MSLNLGLPYTDGEPSSSARKNAVMCMTGKGSEIAAIPVTQQIPLFRCIETSGGYNQDELYFKSASGLNLVNVRRKHLHNSDTDIDGGLLLNQFVYNPRLIQFGMEGFNTAPQFVITKSGAATFQEFYNSSAGRFMILFSAWNGSTGDYCNATVMLGAAAIGFSERVIGFVKMVMDYQINVIARMGFGMEEVQNNVDTTRKAGMEMCGSTGVNWQGVSANGVTRSISATSMNASTYPFYKTYRIFFNPTDATIRITNNDGTTKIITSTVPSGGQVDPVRTWRMGMQSTNSQVKNFYVNHVRFTAHNNDADFFDSAE